MDNLASTGNHDNQKSKRCRKNFDTLKEADAQHELLIREDANCAQHTSLVETTLHLDQVKDVEFALAKLLLLPAPDHQAGRPQSLPVIAAGVLDTTIGVEDRMG